MPAILSPRGTGGPVWNDFSPLFSQIPQFNRMPRAPSTVTFPHTDQNECSLKTPSDMPGSWAQSNKTFQSRERPVLGGVGWRGWTGRRHLHSWDVARCSVFCRNTWQVLSRATQGLGVPLHESKGLRPHPSDTLQRDIPYTTEDPSPTHP